MEHLKRIIESYNPDFAFGYGSGVFKQAGYGNEQQMVDLIFGVKDPVAWHKENKRKHPEDYSFLAGMTISLGIHGKIQEAGAGVWFNSFVERDGVIMKYGVVSLDRLQSDLENWDSLYFAGRTHKPVAVLKGHSQTEALITENRVRALEYALAHSSAHASLEEVFTRIAGISYIGDSRMKYGENPDKVKNIVAGQFDDFKNIYVPLLKKKGLVVKDGCVAHKPKTLARIGDEQIALIVNGPSKSQTLKGLFTTGLTGSITYAREKRRKRKGK